MTQIKGLVSGYQSQSTHEITALDFYVMNSIGDLYDLLPALIPSRKIIDFDTRGHCSSLIKLLPDFSDIFVAHTTWSGYNTMNRIYKFYTLNYSNVASSTVAFSSTPGFLSSVDDYYITDSKLVTMETTLNVYNTKLYGKMSSETLLSWQRAILANRLAVNASSWVDIFAMHNSGTYNNEWMALDLRNFVPGKPAPPNTLWIIEQMPHKVETADMTFLLNKPLYWPSYNVPYFKDIFEELGYPNDTISSYDGCPRANIFRRDQGKVKTIEDMKFLMQYNDYKNDPLSLGNPGYSIASRYDLRITNSKAFGAVDSKVTSYKLALNLESDIICGPTYFTQPVFEWNEQWSNVSHVGQPTRFEFNYVRIGPDTYK